MPDVDRDLLVTLKALSDASRLRIVGLLAARPMAVEELADALGLTPGTVVHHLKRLRDGGLVESRPRHPYVEYSLLLSRLHEVGRALDMAGRTEQAAAAAELPGPDGRARPAFDAKILRAFFEAGRLTGIPSQEKKRRVILRYLAETVFEEQGTYPEKEVNARLALVHPDVASLRRYLVDERFMARRAGEYRRLPETDWPPP